MRMILLLIHPGIQATGIGRLDSLDRMELVITVPEKVAVDSIRGLPIKVRVASHPGRVFEGEVSFVGPRVNAQNRRVRKDLGGGSGVDYLYDGWRVLEERDVDLVLTDHKMPGMTGIELLAEAARLRPDAARLMITGWAGEVPRDQISALDVKVLIPKPWDDGELKAALASHLLR